MAILLYFIDKVVASDESHHSCKNTPRQSHFYEWLGFVGGAWLIVFQKDYWGGNCLTSGCFYVLLT